MTRRVINLAVISMALLPLPAVATSLTCPGAALTTYLNGSAPYSCSETGGITIGFNQNLLPAYAALSAFSGNSALPANITVTPGSSSLSFGGNFVSSGVVAASQAEVVQFDVTSTQPITSTTFSLNNPSVSGLTAAVVGQELVCVGGNFTSLPTGLVTNILNGVLGTGAFGCNGVALVGTAATSIGLLSAVTSLVGLDPTGLSDSVNISIGIPNTTMIDVIKIQALASVALSSASTSGFGDTFATATPEPGSVFTMLSGLALTAALMSRRGQRKPSAEGTACK